jgi:hypothetical protein
LSRLGSELAASDTDSKRAENTERITVIETFILRHAILEGCTLHLQCMAVFIDGMGGSQGVFLLGQVTLTLFYQC